MSIQLIVGLSNPGKQYDNTRHNAGAWFLELIATKANLHFQPEAKYKGLYAKGMIEHHTVHLLIPTTYMNLSGQSVRACAHYLKIPPEHILIVHDEIDLPVGTVKLKKEGGDGGHNGLKDIITQLQTKCFNRLRIGVGRPSTNQPVADYVLDHPSQSERQIIHEALTKAEIVVPFILQGDIQKAMLALHSEKK